jgi:DNA-binding PadR family transcriptional regulator
MLGGGKDMTEEKGSRGRQAMLILSVLAEGPAHGYRITRRLEERSCGEFRLQEGVLYPLLHSLEAAGLADANWEQGSRARDRKVYSLTPAGRDWLRERVAAWRAEQSAIERVLVGEVRPCVG